MAARREKRAALEARGVPAFAYRYERTHSAADALEQCGSRSFDVVFKAARGSTMIDADGREYSIELGSPNSMSRRGWRKTTFLPGDKVTVVINPMRDGAPGGALVYAIDRDGKRMAWR